MNSVQEKFLLSQVNAFPLSPRTMECLSNAKVKYIYELVAKTEGEMLRAKNVGRANLLEIKTLLMEYELTLGMKESVIKHFGEDFNKFENAACEFIQKV